jgi:hypothetical protein
VKEQTSMYMGSCHHGWLRIEHAVVLGVLYAQRFGGRSSRICKCSLENRGREQVMSTVVRDQLLSQVRSREGRMV